MRTLILFCLSTAFSFSQLPFPDSLLKACLARYPEVVKNPSAYKLQIAYTQIDRDKKNHPEFKHFYFRAEKEYIYPASTVKLPLSILALSKLEELNIKGLDKSSGMVTDSVICRKMVKNDTSSTTGFPTLENYIKKCCS